MWSFLNTSLHDVCSLILTEPYTDYIQGSDYQMESLKTHLPFCNPKMGIVRNLDGSQRQLHVFKGEHLE